MGLLVYIDLILLGIPGINNAILERAVRSLRLKFVPESFRNLKK
jgi:hypothetical protein